MKSQSISADTKLELTASRGELVLSAKRLPVSVRALCGDPPVLSSEKPKDYESLFCHMAECIKPTDAIEWLWLKDVVDHTWEIRRLRRFKRQLIEVGLPDNGDAVQLLALPMQHFHEYDEKETARESWEASRRSTESFENFYERMKSEREWQRRQIEERMGGCNKIPRARKRRPSDADATRSFRQCIDDYQTLDRLLTSVEGRRNAVLNEIDRRRDGLGQRWRQASDGIVDAEFSESVLAAE
jgi:hypothetical protein